MLTCEFCADGSDSASGSSGCTNCTAGTTSQPARGAGCAACAAGKYAAQPGAADCEQCDVVRHVANLNRTGCVCAHGFFDANLYPKLTRDEVTAWKDQPSVVDCGRGPCCVDCTKVVCPADVCKYTVEEGEEVESLVCSTKHQCVQCPGGVVGGEEGPAFMWPKKMFWVPDPEDLSVDPLGIDRTADMLFVVPVRLNAVEQCHPHDLCAGLPSHALPGGSPTELALSDYDACRKDPTQCCTNAKVQGGRMCGECVADKQYARKQNPTTT